MTDAAIWLRVSTGHQTTDNQTPDVDRFAGHRGYRVVATYSVQDTAYKAGGGAAYKATLSRALADAHQGKFKVLIVWALDRIVRDDESGAEAALRIIRQFRERGVAVVSVKEDWLNGSPEIQDVLVAFAGWMAQRESARRSERIRAGLARRAAEGKPVGGANSKRGKDLRPRRTDGYLARYRNSDKSA